LGLGYVIMVAGANFKIDRQFSAIIVLCLIGMVFFALTSWAERRLIPWHISIRGERQ
jgi:NitT/TauT family transport system permease protein